MKVVLAAAGSRGDVVPFAALALGLVVRGHEVELLAHGGHVGEPYVDSATGPQIGGVAAMPRIVAVPGDPSALLSGPAGAALRRGDLRALSRSRHHFASFLTAFTEPTRRALPGADIIVASTFAVAAVDEALRAGVPVVRAHQWPENPGLDGPMPLLPYSWRLSRRARRNARRALRRVEPFLGGLDGGWRRGRLQLHPHHPVGLTTTTHGTLHAYSPLVGPTPAPGVHVTGWWYPPQAVDLSAATAARLDADEPWVFVGFGSMPQRRPVELVNLVAAVSRRLGVRAVVQLDPRFGITHPEVLVIGPEEHSALFPRMAAVVHHGGSGTTGTAVRCGIPSVVVPHVADQFYWGHRLHRLAVAGRPIPRPRLTEASLLKSLREALDPGVRQRARRLGRQVSSENGVARAVAMLEGLLAGQHP